MCSVEKYHMEAFLLFIQHSLNTSNVLGSMLAMEVVILTGFPRKKKSLK